MRAKSLALGETAPSEVHAYVLCRVGRVGLAPAPQRALSSSWWSNLLGRGQWLHFFGVSTTNEAYQWPTPFR